MIDVLPDNDKPHRCPHCGSIPDEARKDGKALPGKLYQCEKCQVQWVKDRYRATLSLIDLNAPDPAKTEIICIGFGQTEEEARFSAACATDIIKELKIELNGLKAELEAINLRAMLEETDD